MSKQAVELLSRVQQDRGKDSPAAIIYERLVNRLRPETAKALTPSMVKSVCTELTPGDIFDALLYLSSERMGLLEFHTALLDEEGNFCDFDTREVTRYLKDRLPLVNPITHDYINNLDDAIVYFSGTALLASLTGGPNGTKG